MTTKLLTTVAAAVIVTAGGVALAQEDHNNPAPSYGAMAPVANKNVKHIQDGTNGAPRYASRGRRREQERAAHPGRQQRRAALQRHDDVDRYIESNRHDRDPCDRQTSR